MEERLRKLGQKIDELIAKARGSKPAMDARVDAYMQALRAGVAEARKHLDELNTQQAAARERTQARLDGDLNKLDAEMTIVEAEGEAALAQDRAAFEAAVKRALEGWRKRIDDLQAMAATREKGARENVDAAIQRLRERRETASGKLKEVRDASGAAFDELRKGVSNALHELHRAADEAASKFEELRRIQNHSKGGHHDTD